MKKTFKVPPTFEFVDKSSIPRTFSPFAPFASMNCFSSVSSFESYSSIKYIHAFLEVFDHIIANLFVFVNRLSAENGK